MLRGPDAATLACSPRSVSRVFGRKTTGTLTSDATTCAKLLPRRLWASAQLYYLTPVCETPRRADAVT